MGFCGIFKLMQKDHTTLNKIFGGLSFLISLVLYVLSMPPTAPFWDSPEFITCAYWLQIPHPPGSPFLLLLGRLFSMWVSPENVAYMVNMVSTVSSAFTILLLYLIIVRFVREFHGDPAGYDLIDRLALYGGAFIGAMTFMVSDSYWITATEAETYAVSLFFTSLTVWLTLKWSEQADRPGHERYLILIAYVFGLAFGVHLLSLLSTFFTAMIVYFRKWEFSVMGFLIMGAASVGIFFAIYPGTIIWLPSAAEQFGSPGLFFLMVLVLVGWGLYHTHTRGHRLANILLLGYSVILIGYSSYALIFIRAQTQPPVDQNAPENIGNFISYLKREQYGSTPLLTGNTFDNAQGTIDRSKESLFPRRYSREPRHLEKYAQYSSDLDFFWDYQMGHMYFRYFAWNFIGRDSDLQDAPWTDGFRSSDHKGTPGHNVYFYLPFLIGVFGMMYHFVRDRKRAAAVLVLFVVTGIAIVVYLNQYPFQPRERDYSYTGSFFAFSIWIGIGVTGLIHTIRSYWNHVAGTALILVLLLVGMPVWMGFQNWDDHDRSEQYVAPDYAYNLLNSLAPNAIIFTNGDNDTFPLWYLQDVEGVRRDVRVVNLSLLNTSWYIDQMKNRWNYEAEPVPISYTDEQIRNIERKFEFRNPTDFWTPQEVVIPVDKSLLASEVGANNGGFGVPIDRLDDAVRFYYEGNFLGTDASGRRMHYTRVQDDLVLDILRTNQWKRPVYFAITVSGDGQLNLQPYFRLEGKAFRVVPIRHDDPFGYVDPVIHGQRLHTFRLREVANPDAYFDENTRRMLDNYRTIITRQAQTWAQAGRADSALYWLQWGEEKIPFTTIQGDLTSLVTYALRYAQYGGQARAGELADMALEPLEKSMRNNIEFVDRLDNEILELEAAIQRNRTDRSLVTRHRSLSDRRGSAIREVSFDSSRFMIVQHIRFLIGDTAGAAEIAVLVNDITGGRIPFPTDPAETAANVQRIMGE